MWHYNKSPIHALFAPVFFSICSFITTTKNTHIFLMHLNEALLIDALCITTQRDLANDTKP